MFLDYFYSKLVKVNISLKPWKVFWGPKTDFFIYGIITCLVKDVQLLS